MNHLWSALLLLPMVSLASSEVPLTEKDPRGLVAEGRNKPHCPRPVGPPALLLQDIRPGPVGSGALTIPSERNGTFFFEAANEESGFEPWVSDGSAGGTRLLKDIIPGAAPSFINRDIDLGSAVAGGAFFFPATDGVIGVELWTSDGTEAGTRLVKDINAGPGRSLPSFPISTGRGRLFFRVDDGVHGFEPWVSDGTQEGTFLVKDIRSGPEGSNAPFAPVRVGRTIYFNADDGIHGGSHG